MAFYTVRVDDSGNEMERPHTFRDFEARRYKSQCNMSARCPTTSRGSLSLRSSIPTASVDESQDPDASDESIGETVPPLDLNSSGETMPSESGPGMSFVIRKTQSDAFSNWLSVKRKQKINEIARKKELEQEQIRLKEEKKEIAQKKYQEWLSRKAQSKNKPVKRELQDLQVYPSQIDDNESNRRAWEQSKQEELRRKKEAVLRATQRQKMLEEQRQKQAAEAWENWIAEAPLKPKPVPLNRGFLTLKGTVSDIFVNPNPWRDICEIQD